MGVVVEFPRRRSWRLYEAVDFFFKIGMGSSFMDAELYLNRKVPSQLRHQVNTLIWEEHQRRETVDA